MRYAAKTFGYSFGVAYLLLSIVGFAVTGFFEFLSADAEYHLIVLRMNPFQNIVNMLLGMALFTGAAGTEAIARRTVLFAGLVLVVIGITGFYAIGQPWNIMAMNEAVGTLYIATALLALIVAGVSQPGEATSEEGG